MGNWLTCFPKDAGLSEEKHTTVPLISKDPAKSFTPPPEPLPKPVGPLPSAHLSSPPVSPAQQSTGSDLVEYEEVEEEVEEDVLVSTPEPVWCDSFGNASLLKGKPTDRTQVQNLTLDCTVAEFWDVLFSDNALPFVSAYHEKRGDKELVVPKWHVPHPKFGSYREKKFRSPVDAPMAPPSTRSVETQKYSLVADRIQIESTQSVLDVPYGDHFVVETVYSGTVVGSQLVLTISVGLFFHKSTMFKGKITTQTMKESAESFKLWANLARDALQQRKSEPPKMTKVKKIIRVRRPKDSVPSSATSPASFTATDTPQHIPTPDLLALFHMPNVAEPLDTAPAESLASVSVATLFHEPSETFREPVIAFNLSDAASSASDGLAHRFKSKTFKSPHWCAQCGDFIWGAWKQGKICQVCIKPLHHKCAETSPANCDGTKHDHSYWYAYVQEQREKSGATTVAMAMPDSGSSSDLALASGSSTPGPSPSPARPEHPIRASSEARLSFNSAIDMTMGEAPPPPPSSSSSSSAVLRSSLSIPAPSPPQVVLSDHKWKTKTFKKPTWCIECTEFIWGAFKQGKICIDCQAPIHHKCASAKQTCDRVKHKSEYWRAQLKRTSSDAPAHSNTL